MNYIGSKFSLLPFLHQCITTVVDGELKDLVFCDLFAGTGAVGKFFKKQGCSIIANDLQYYSYVLNKHYIENHTLLLFKGLEKDIPQLTHVLFEAERATAVCEFLDALHPESGFVFRNFCKGEKTEEEGYRLYFSDDNGKKCDAIRMKIEEWEKEGKITSAEYFFLLTTLIENIDKVANTASVYGAFLKKIKSSAAKPITMTPAETILNEREHQVFNTDANRLVKEIKADILYLDPPYNHRQYSANYHLLETIARYDAPQLRGKTGMRDYSDQRSAYSSRQKVVAAFEELIRHANAKYIFLSYNNEGLMTFDTIKEIMGRRGEYGCFEQSYNRFQADRASENRKIKAAHTTEYVHFVKVKTPPSD